MKVVHVVPRESVFIGVLFSRANACGHKIFSYTHQKKTIISRSRFIVLLLRIWLFPRDFYVFHYVPHNTIRKLRKYTLKFRYGLVYWGDDYYSTFLPVSYYEYHCIKKSHFFKNFFDLTLSSSTNLFSYRKVKIGLEVINGAEALLSLSPKQYRIIRKLHIVNFGKPINKNYIKSISYSHKPNMALSFESSAPTFIEKPASINALICHSAASTTNHMVSIEILRLYAKKHNIEINVFGFLSYSGGSEDDRQILQDQLESRLDFAKSICFERNFLTKEELSERLSNIDLAVFSALRDEGVSLLTQFVELGGILSFNRFSMNYDFFQSYSPNKLLTHEKLLQTSPQALLKMRYERPILLREALEFESLNELFTV